MNQTSLTMTLALLASLTACGNLDETDSDPPSVVALARWSDSELVALRTYHKDPLIVDLQSGTTTGTLRLSSEKYYSDIEPIGNGELICLHNQSIDFFGSSGLLDESRSITGALFTKMTTSADHSTLAYALAIDQNHDTVQIVDLPSGAPRYSPGTFLNVWIGLSLSRDGNLVAFPQDGVAVAPTHPPAPDVPAVADCTLAYAPPIYGGALATAFSPVEDKLAVTKVDGGVNIFDVGHYPDCSLLLNVPSPDNTVAQTAHVQYSPDGSVLAFSVETGEASQTPGVEIMRGVIRLIDAGTGVTLSELPIYRWEMTPDLNPGGPTITDLQWSDAGDRISVSTTDGPVQHWDVTTGTLLWSAKL